ncbi:hypothetical protein ACJX0J_027535, partial [Zea mays]
AICELGSVLGVLEEFKVHVNNINMIPKTGWNNENLNLGKRVNFAYEPLECTENYPHPTFTCNEEDSGGQVNLEFSDEDLLSSQELAHKKNYEGIIKMKHDFCISDLPETLSFIKELIRKE